jgi:alpha-glucoside transport system substrate-binding protein
MRHLRLPAAILLMLALLPACGSSDRGSLSILTPWTTGTGLEDFTKLTDGFKKTPEGRGVDVQTTPTRATKQALEAAIHNHRPPDLAIVPTPGVLRDYVGQGQVQNLNSVLDPAAIRREYGPTWLGFERAGTNNLYAVVVKADLKSRIWYNKHTYDYPVPTTWSELTGVTDKIAGRNVTPWCMSMSDPPSSGWPGTDWIEDILLHQSGPILYAQFAQSDLPWTSPQVKAAWQTWGDVIAPPGRVYGGRLSAMLGAYSDNDNPMFAKKPRCYLSHGAFLADDPPPPSPAKPPVAGVDGDFFTFPSLGAPGGTSYEVSADLMAMFHPSPQAEAFLRYLVSKDAQELWPAADKDAAFTPGIADLHDELAHRLKGPVGLKVDQILTSGRPLCFDASDWMPDVMANAFYRATLTYLDNPSSARLDSLLQQLESVRQKNHPKTSAAASGTACGPAAT